MKKTKIIASIVALTCTMGVLSAKPKANSSASPVSGKLSVWSFTDEIDGMVNNSFKPTHPNVQVETTITPTQEFPGKLDAALAGEEECPDVIALEVAFVRKYVESGELLPLDDIYAEIKKDLAEYPVKIGSADGHVYALSWQVCPGAMFYRRSLAKKYLGTDDPKKVQSFFTDPDKFLETAKLIKDKSFGRCYIVSSSDDLFNVYKGSRTQPWVADNQVVVDPAMSKYMEVCKILHEQEMCGNYGQWSQEWFAGLKGTLQDEEGEDKEVFCTFLPTWGLDFVLKTNAPETSGDWAMIQGPAGYSWGGTWIGVYKGTKNPEAAKEMVKYFVSDPDFLTAYAVKTGDVVSNLKIQSKLKGKYKEPYLKGQNHYKEFCDMAKTVNGSLVQGTDQVIEELFNEEVRKYIYEGKAKKDAIKDFKDRATEKLGL